MNISSPVFGHHQYIPPRYTCDGININPPLDISNIPEDTVSLVLIVNDPDAPKGDWIHWVVVNINPQVHKVLEDTIPTDGVEIPNDSGSIKYTGPCPPSGTHHYFFKLFALDINFNINKTNSKNFSKNDVENLMRGHILEGAELIGLYRRQ